MFRVRGALLLHAAAHTAQVLGPAAAHAPTPLLPPPEPRAVQEKQAKDEPRGAANGKPAPAPQAGQHVDVAALLGGRPQPSSPGGVGSPASAAGSERAGAEGVRSRFANFFKLEESPAPGAAAAAAAAAAAGGAKPQQLSFEHLSKAAAGSQQGMPAMPTAHVATPGEIEQRMPPPGAPPPGQARDAGQALLAMLKQQQAAQRAATGGAQQPRPMLPPNAVSAADVTVLEEADKVARLTALQVRSLPCKGDGWSGPESRVPLNLVCGSNCVCPSICNACHRACAGSQSPPAVEVLPTSLPAVGACLIAGPG